MREMTINLERDEILFHETGKTVYFVRRSDGEMSGFFNKFNIFLRGKQADEIESMFECERKFSIPANVYAYPDARFNSGYRFEQF